MSGDSKDSEISLERVLSLMDKWRHLPAYQLERRADVLFATFLPEVMNKERFCTNDLNLIPEFPIKKSILQTYGEDDTEQSINVDYLAVCEDMTRAFLIELKTDMMSIKKEQIEDLNCARGRRMTEIVHGLKSIATSGSVASDRIIRGKYYCLLNELSELGLVENLDVGRLRNLVTAKRMKHEDYRCCICRMEVSERAREIDVDVVYVIPRIPEDEKIKNLLSDVCQIHFDTLAKYAGSRFAESLKKWQVQAGLCPR